MSDASFNLSLSEAQERLRQDLHDVARNVLRKAAADAERRGMETTFVHDHLAKAGLSASELLSAGPADPHTLLMAAEELSYGDPGIAWAVAPHWQLAQIVARCGSAAQRRIVQKAFASSPSTTARVLMYEDFGRQPSELETRVHRQNDGQWTAEGRKTSVAHPAGAGASLLVALDSDRRELCAFVFTGDRPGIKVDRDDGALGKVAITATPTGTVAISGLSLRADEQLPGGIELHRAVGQARLLLAAALVGTARASIEFCAAYAQERTTWGKPIADYQAISFPLVEHSTEINEVRLLTWDVAAKLSSLDNVEAIERHVTRAVNRASSLAMRATRDGVQLIGVRAITRDLPSERWYRSAAVLGAIDFDILHTPFGLN